jgi:hypothetical protein
VGFWGTVIIGLLTAVIIALTVILAVRHSLASHENGGLSLPTLPAEKRKVGGSTPPLTTYQTGPLGLWTAEI